MFFSFHLYPTCGENWCETCPKLDSKPQLENGCKSYIKVHRNNNWIGIDIEANTDDKMK